MRTTNHPHARLRPNLTTLMRCATTLFVATALCGLSGCERKPAPEKGTPTTQPGSEKETGSAQAPGGGTDGKYLIGFSQCTVTEPWRVEFNRRLIAHAKADYAKIVDLEVLDANDKTEDQVAQMRSFIDREADAILISPKEAAGLTGVVRQAAEAGIPVIVLDRDVHFDGYTCFVGGDNKLIGRAAGMVARDMLGGEGKASGVIYELCGGLASTPGQERRDGFHEVVDKEPGLEVIGGLDCDWKLSKAKDAFQAALQANEAIDLVYAHNDPMAYGAYQAAKEAGREEEMSFIGIDSLPDEGIRWVKAGQLTATLLYPTPGEMGLDMAIKALRGEEVTKRITLPTRVFTKDNVDQGGKEISFDE